MIRSRSSHFILAAVALVVTGVFIWMLITHSDLRGIWTGFYMLVLPFFLIGSAAFCVRAGVHTAPTVSYRVILLGMVLLLLACYVIADITGGTGGLSFILWLPALVEGLIAIPAIVHSTQSKRKKFALLISIMFPVSLLLSIFIGFSFTEEQSAQRNGDQLIRALSQYQLDSGKYPSDLSELLPVYLPKLPALLLRDNSGWLYNSNGDMFALEFKYYPDNRTIGSCAFSSQRPHWNCSLTDLRGRPVSFMQNDTHASHMLNHQLLTTNY